MPRRFELGLALNAWRSYIDGAVVVGWAELRDLARHAETIGFDTVWFPDTPIGRLVKGGPVYGQWDIVPMLGALAAATDRVQIGSWVFASLFRDPGLIAKQAATIDEISGGRFVLGYGAGGAGTATRAFGVPDDHAYERFEEALEVLVPLLRTGHADFEGTYRQARDLPQLPTGPRPGAIPLLLAAHGAKGYRHAARLADIWSCYAVGTSDVAEFGPRIHDVEAACVEVGRDPATLGRSAGIIVAPLAGMGEPVPVPFGVATTGPAEHVIEALTALRDAGYTQVEMMPEPMTMAAVDALAPVVQAFATD